MKINGQIHTTHALLEEKELLHLSDVNGFPVDVFPAPLRKYIEENLTYRGWDPDLSGPATLAAAASAIGNTHRARGNGKEVAPVLFVILTAPPGTAKSDIAEAAFRPFRERQQQLYNMNSVKSQGT